MSKIEFVKLENQNTENQIVTGIFLNEGKPIAYGHFEQGTEQNKDLCLAFKKGESDKIYISDYVMAVWETTGIFHGHGVIRITESEPIVKSIIERWEKQVGRVA